MIPTLLLSALLTSFAHDAVPPAGFVAIFNGKDLTGWHGWNIHARNASPSELAKLSVAERKAKIEEWTLDARKHWSVANGELINDGHGAYLSTEKEYRDYELLLEYRTVAKADSGIYLKGTPQVQIWDSTETAKFNIGADKGSGGLWNNSAGAKGKDPLALADRPFGQWNQFRILQIGERTSVWLNDQLVVEDAVMENFWDRKARLQPQGPILLQTHGGEIRWRNIFVREISTAEASDWLRRKSNERWIADSKVVQGSGSGKTTLVQSQVALTDEICEPRAGLLRRLFSSRRGSRERYVISGDALISPAERLSRMSASAGFQSLFNGVDFSGWAGPVENYEIQEGAIVCKPKKGGTIYTQEEWGDFIVRLEFKLPAGGNNGLAIRYTGKGDAAYSGMTELQILDDGHPMYARIDKRQAHGSAYGMVPAHRGYLRPAGQWNYQEVTVKGQMIRVELNGTTILDCDLSKVTEFMGGTPHPGKDRTKGHFGFAGHSDPVMFRNIEIKKLD